MCGKELFQNKLIILTIATTLSYTSDGLIRKVLNHWQTMEKHRFRSVHHPDVLLRCVFHYPDVFYDHNQYPRQRVLMQLQVSGAGVGGTVHQARENDPHQEGASKDRSQSDKVLHAILTDHHVMRLQVLQPASPTRHVSPINLFLIYLIIKNIYYSFLTH